VLTENNYPLIFDVFSVKSRPAGNIMFSSVRYINVSLYVAEPFLYHINICLCVDLKSRIT